MSYLEFFAVAALGLTAGTLIGCIGIGGVIVVPILVQAGFGISTAITVAMAGYILTGVVGTWVFVRRGTLDRRLVGPLCIGSMPAAIVGALAAQKLPSTVLELLIAAMTFLSGLHSLLRRPRDSASGEATPLSRSLSAAIGAVAGLVSSVTGTGGPAALIPLLLWLDVPILATVGLAQVIQLPIGILATVGNLTVAGAADLPLGLVLGLGLAAGARVGAEIAHHIDPRRLKTLVAAMLLGVGLVMLGRVGVREAHSLGW